MLCLEMAKHIVCVKYWPSPSWMRSVFLLALQAHESFASQHHMFLQLLALALDAPMKQGG